MMQTDKKTPLLVALVLLAIAAAGPRPLAAADRTTLLIPLDRDANTGDLPSGVFADEASGDAASDGWKAYLRLWKAHYKDPSDPMIRRFLGLPLAESFEATARRGRSAPRSLNWAPGSYAQVDTPHFVIYSHAAEAPSKQIAEDLERCYWVWTQMFFPLWEASQQVSAALGEMPADASVQDFLKQNPARITVRRKLRVVLFRDAAEYAQTLSPEVPGIERSTGYYDNGKQTIFLYAAENDDAATRRHEMVHQLFREATRSGLGRSIPGDDTGFWLIEGIAGYFESLYVGEQFATVGGWDSSRLQFARFRMFSGGDRMPMSELRKDGRIAAQQQSNIARWYAHAIAQTHQLMDGGNVRSRQAVYQQLATRYKIKTELPEVDVEAAFAGADKSIVEFLSIDDAHLVDNPVLQPPQRLVLAGCRVTAQGLSQVPPAPDLVWLDLANTPIGNADVLRLAPNPASIEQLRLEATQVDAGLVDWLRKATNLRELDLSSTRVDDSMVEAFAAAGQLSLLWLTGTDVTDNSIDRIAKLANLEMVDLQQTKITNAGIARLRAARPNLQINP